VLAPLQQGRGRALSLQTEGAGPWLLQQGPGLFKKGGGNRCVGERLLAERALPLSAVFLSNTGAGACVLFSFFFFSFDEESRL